jgi:hypothetical protein
MPRRGTSKSAVAPLPQSLTDPFGRSQTPKARRLRQPAVEHTWHPGLAQTSPCEVCDAPQGHPRERHGAIASIPHRSLREIADAKSQASAPARLPPLAETGFSNLARSESFWHSQWVSDAVG